MDKNKIMVLCKVVDNFGDIGVCYRLCRALSDLRSSLEITLVVSDLHSFHALCPKIDPKKPVQDFRYKNSVWKILDWNLEIENRKLKNGFPSVILECFQCGRPDWLEGILFSDDFTQEVQILNIDYLTAEDYAEEFHLLKSGTRKTNIKKRFFMPGFTEKTAGLIFNEQLAMSNEQFTESNLQLSMSNEQFIRNNLQLAMKNENSNVNRDEFKIFFFAYEDDCSAVVKGISDFQAKIRECDADFSVLVFLASGKSSLPFEIAWKNAGTPFKIEKIPFLPQEEFDEFLLKMDFLFVRGEDSLARACLSGLPFVWQAYKQDENYQIVKVNALLERMKPFFPETEFESIQIFWQNYNDYENPTKPEPLTKMLFESANQKNTNGFKEFAQKLHENGNLAEHLLEFIDGL